MVETLVQDVDVIIDVNGDESGSVELSDATISSIDLNNIMNDNDKIEAADDPWDVILKFIQTNILFGSNNNNNNNQYDDTTTTATTISENGDDRSRSTSTSSGRSKSGNNNISPQENIWNSFPTSRTNDVEQNDVSKFDTAEEPRQQQEQQLNDIIKEGWNQFIQNLGVLPNPFIPQKDDSSDDASSTSPHHQNLHTNTDSSHHRYDALTELIESVSSAGHHQYNNKNQLSIPDMIDLFWKTLQNVKKQLEGTFKSVLDLIVPIVNPLQLYYFMLEQEIIHNPVYKRRQHAYLTEVSVNTAVQISEGLYVSQLAYANDCITIQKYLKNFQNNSWILINCTTTPRPFEPAHFLAIRHSASEPNVTWNYPMESSNDASSSTASTSWTTMLWENIRDALSLTNTDGSKNNKNMKLEAMLVICGTKDVADMMSDALLAPTPYGNSTHQGLVHSGIHQSALYIHNTYRDFFENLIIKTNRTMLKLWLIGHSLGGGTAALACLEFNKPYHATNISTSSRNSNDTTDNINIHNDQNNTIPSIDAYALGFGTPAVLSREYSENARSKVTTIINDADCVPRMSGATLVNFLLNVTASNHWIKEAQIDVLHLKDIMKEKSPFPDIWVDTVMSTVYDWIASSDIVNDTMKAALSENVVEPVLFPPGECIHIYRDGTSWQSVYYPCRNFDALEGVRYMVDDHLIPTGYYRGLLGYIRGSKNDMNWQFKPDLTEIPVSS